MRKSFILAAALAAFGGPVLAGSADLKWNASGTSGQNAATGYNVFYGTAKGGPYPNKLAVGNVTTAKVPNLTSGQTYCFVVTAFNVVGESGYSNEACAAIPFPPATAAPAPATGLSASGNP